MRILISFISFFLFAVMLIELIMAKVVGVRCFYFVWINLGLGITCEDKPYLASAFLAAFILSLFRKSQDEKNIEDHLIG